MRQDGTLVITQVVPRDAGKYICTATSVGGAIKITADMNLAVVQSKWDSYSQVTLLVETERFVVEY